MADNILLKFEVNEQMSKKEKLKIVPLGEGWERSARI